MQKRLEELRAELEKGQRHLEHLERQRQDTRETMLRISGAIQVLEELVRQEIDPDSATTVHCDRETVPA